MNIAQAWNPQWGNRFWLTRGVLAFALVLPLALHAQEAMLMDLSGEVAETAGGTQKKAEILDYLQAGSELRLGKQATAKVILLAPSTEVRLAGPGSYRIGKDKIETVNGADPASSALNAAIATQAHKFEPAVRERMAMAAIVTRDIGTPKAPQLQGPGGVTVLDPSPPFWWSSDPAAVASLTVWDAGGNAIWRRAQVQPGARIDIALAPGAYEWAIETGGISSGRAQFEVADDTLRKDFPPLAPTAPFSERLVRAIALENAGYGYDAWMLWKQLSAERPDNATLAKMAQ